MSGCFYILKDNYADKNILADYDVSSEKIQFPVLNAFNLNRRSKVWRSDGFFEVVDGENTLVFNEGAGDLTATIIAGFYYSITDFMQAIEDAFNLAGATYNVVQTSLLKIQIQKTVGNFTLKLTDPLSFYFAELIGFDIFSDITAQNITADVIRIHSSEWIQFDFGIESNPTDCVMIGQRNKPINIGKSASILIEGNFTNNFSSPAFSAVIPYDDEVLWKGNVLGLFASPMRYARIKIMDNDNPNGFIELGAFFLGLLYEPIRGRVIFPFETSQVDRTTLVTSEGGQAFADTFQKVERFTARWFGLLKQDREGLRECFEFYGKSLPFFVIMDAHGAGSTSPQRMIKYVRFESEPRFSLSSPNLWSCDMSLLEQL